jgi:hypothetical protein
LSLNDAELEKDSWTCTAGHYENGKIVCIVPQLEDFDPDSLQFNVDVALNGQQFTGKPIAFRYYNIDIKEISPNLGNSEGGAIISIKGKGLYDSANKKIKFEVDGGERVVAATWDRKEKALNCIVPPLLWLFGGAEIPEEEIQKIMKQPVKVYLTFNLQEWILADHFYYHDSHLDRLQYCNNYRDDIADLEERQQAWLEEEAIEQYPEDMPEEEKAKKEDEKAKKAEEETAETQAVAKRKGVKMMLHGSSIL